MGWLILATALAAQPGSMVSEANGAQVRVVVRSSEYTYEVMNTGRDPITRFEVPYCNAYGFHVPAHWQQEVEGGVFRAWTDNPWRGISGGRSLRFGFRVSSYGAVLGRADLRVERASGTSAKLPNTWVPVPERRSHVILTAAVMLAIFAGHGMATARLGRRRRPATAP